MMPDDSTGNGRPPIDFSQFPKIRNRKEVRALEKVLRRSGKTKQEINNIIDISKMVTQAYDNEGRMQSRAYLYEGEMVKLNVDKMWSQPDWGSRQEEYKSFVHENIDTIFLVKYIDDYKEKPSIVSLIDESGQVPTWIFCDNDLLVYDAKDKTFKELWLIEEDTTND